MINPETSERECGLCFDMEWDEAIYCPQCHGSGKVYVDPVCSHPFSESNLISEDGETDEA